MARWVTSSCALYVLLAFPPANVLGQFPYGDGSTGYRTSADPRVRRAHREAAVAKVGPSARDFVETEGDEAVAAIFACSKPVAVKLVEFYASGEMGKLPRPRELLLGIAQPGQGDDVALWAIQHAGELTDADSFDAFLISPLEYALGLKQLAAGASEVRARRLSRVGAARTSEAASLVGNRKLAIIGGAVLLSIVGLVQWRRRGCANVLVQQKERASFSWTKRE